MNESESGNHIANWVLSASYMLNLQKMGHGICQRNIIFLKIVIKVTEVKIFFSVNGLMFLVY